MKNVKVKLFSPEMYGDQPCSFFDATNEQIQQYTNGCGSGSGEKYVPDKLLGLSIRNACLIHDWMYAFGASTEDKKRADFVFLNNMIRIIESRNGFFLLKKARLYLARVYYMTVKYLGGPYFWDSKNSDDEFLEM